jgi:hypothetical protein
MKRSVSLGVEVLESRDTPSGTPFGGGVFLPVGMAHAISDPNLTPPPPPLQPTGAFAPPGVTCTIDLCPPPVAHDVFLPPAHDVSLLPPPPSDMP